MPVSHSIQIIKDMAAASGVDTTTSNWQEQHQRALEQEEDTLVEKMASLMKKTIQSSANTPIPDNMETQDRYSELCSATQLIFTPDTSHLDMSLPPADRAKQAALCLILSCD